MTTETATKARVGAQQKTYLRVIYVREQHGQASVYIDNCYTLPGVDYSPSRMQEHSGGYNDHGAAQKSIIGLAKKGLLEETSYRTYRLTNEGRAIAEKQQPIRHRMDS